MCAQCEAKDSAGKVADAEAGARVQQREQGEEEFMKSEACLQLDRKPLVASSKPFRPAVGAAKLCYQLRS